MRPRLVTAALTGAAALAGSLGTRPASDWYESLDKPDWQPPKAAFPLVWTPLYGLIAWGTGRALEKAVEQSPRDGRRVLALTTADLAANAGWCWVFFA
ncbi:MAG: tryptophan-rich sensory protein, partial [Nocardioidaceae bacterium]|nr:tryptophan-rich sensory protein [Nocardioidaceae bacterium]